MRLLVTGSREWNDPELIRDYFRRVWALFDGPANQVTVVHGGARGADRMAGALAPTFGFEVEPHYANWEPWGRGNGVDKAAGWKRNAEMVKAGADACVAVKDGFSLTRGDGGTEHCVKLAIRAGIPWELVCHQRDYVRVDL